MSFVHPSESGNEDGVPPYYQMIPFKADIQNSSLGITHTFMGITAMTNTVLASMHRGGEGLSAWQLAASAAVGIAAVGSESRRQRQYSMSFGDKFRMFSATSFVTLGLLDLAENLGRERWTTAALPIALAYPIKKIVTWARTE
jgi:hypothetical protein